jgi:PAS domain S-box-containing protein
MEDNNLKETSQRLTIYQLKAILNNIPDIAWLKDSESRFVAVNEPFGEACGIKPEELVGKTDLDIWPEHLARRYRADDKEVISSGRRKLVEEPFEDSTGKQTWIETIKTPVYDDAGNIIGTTGIARDITERKKGEEELKTHKDQLEKLVEERTAEFKTAINFLTDEIESRKRAEETLRENELKMRNLHAMKALGELAAGVAHEVRNPLHALMSVTEALKKELKDNPDFDIYLFHIRKQVERLSVLMKDLLDLGKPIEPSHMRTESLWNICMASIDLWKNSPSRKGHTISFVQPPGNKGFIVTGDSQRLQQVFLNLLENAAYHSPAGSDIQVVIFASADDMVRVRVIDQGPGIPAEILPRIFEPFFTTRSGGTGLGLSIIKNILDGHGGSLVVWNNPGCTAEVILPLANEENQ